MKALFFFSLALFCNILTAQIVNIPDANFENALVNENVAKLNGNALFTKLGFKLFEIPVINGTVKKDYRDYYTEKSKALVAAKCQKDIDYFNYSF